MRKKKVYNTFLGAFSDHFILYIDDMFKSSIEKLLKDMKKEKNNNPTYNNPKYIEHKIPDYHIQDIDHIKNKKDSCWSKYCSCCPCL